MSLDLALAAHNPSTVPSTTMGTNSVLFEDIYARHHIDVFRYALVLTSSRDEADDVAAEAFARAWRAWRSGHEPDGPALPWLFAITRNIATDRWRRLGRVVTRLIPSRAADGYAEVEAMLWLAALVRVLPPRQREVIALRYHRDLGDAEIARLMGLTESGVRSLVGRAIAKLRQHPEVWR
jgi:RNA polymerase sigma factor (sigma-70 family)